MRHYRLKKDGEPVREDNALAWARWFATADRRVALDRVNQAKVSTVFLGLDHSFGMRGPVLWETMVFGGELDQEQDRCGGSREQAETMHRKMVERVKAASESEARRGKR